MTNPLSVHGIFAHFGNIAGRSDREWLADWNPAWVKIITDDETVPYIEDVPPAAKIIVRNYPLSELGHDRGFSASTARTAADMWYGFYSEQEGSGRDFHRPDLYNPEQSRDAGPGAFAMMADEYDTAFGANDLPERVGKEHAAICNRIAQWCESKGVPRSRLWFEGLNEPMLWSVEPPALVARYYAEFLRVLHGYNLRGVAGNFGVGWPGNGGVKDAPVQWDVFKPMIDAMVLDPARPDYLGLHEYWALNGVAENWRWWAGRYEQCPYHVPILITETGIDTGVTGRFYGGWGDLPGQMTDRARRYVGELAWYWNKCRADGRIQGIFPFTYDRGTDTWVQFDIRNEDWLREFTSRKAEFPEPMPFVPTVKPEPKPKPQPTDTLLQALQSGLGEKYLDWRAKVPRREGVQYPFEKRISKTVTHIVVHHDAVALARIPDLWHRVEVIARAHIARNYSSAAYHFIIGPDGTVAQLNGLDVVSWHSGDRTMNRQSIGVCFAGDYRTDEPTDAALLAYNRLFSILAGWLPNFDTDLGHRDVTQTECPGDNLYSALFGSEPKPEPMPNDEPVASKEKVIYWTEVATRAVEAKEYDKAHATLLSLIELTKRM